MTNEVRHMSRAASSIPSDSIGQSPDICGGAPVIAGTRIRVSLIVHRYERERQSPDEIVQAYPHLTLAQVHSALAYYYSHRESIDNEIASTDEFLLRVKHTYPSKVLGHSDS
jgi:uncharacterized protein (DUF433 family)